MLTILPSTTLFFSTLITGTIIAVSSPNWLIVWAGLEINLLSFIPLIIQAQSHNETEGAVKYFLTQALGSSLLLFSARLFYYGTLSNINFSIPIFIFIVRLLIKIGAAPFHFWFPRVMSILRWPLCILLATWQKIAPLIIASSFIPLASTNLIILVGVTGALIGGLGGLNQSQLRGLLAYSSIGHLGWIVSSFTMGQRYTAFYLLIYIFIRASLFILLYSSKSYSRNTSSIITLSPIFAFSVLILLLSLGGIPPLLGFAPKWLILEALTSKGFIFSSFFLIIGSLINLFYYITIFINFFINPPVSIKTKTNNNFSPWPRFIASLSIIFSPLVFILYAMTVFYKSQRHWHTLFYFWGLSRTFRDIYKTFNSSGARSTRSPFRKRPVI